MSASVRRRATIAVLAAVASLVVLYAMSGGEPEDEAVRDVAEVRHQEVHGIPREPEVRDRPADQTMQASYYGRTLEGWPMANGQPFDADAYTAAHRRRPFGTKLGVAYGDQYVRVTVTDRGPYGAGRGLDLSLAATRGIGLTVPGEAPVRVTRP